MKILVLRQNIIAVDPTDTGDQWETADQIIPRHVVEGAELVEVEALPLDYEPGKYQWLAGFELIPVLPNPESIKAKISILEVQQTPRRIREATLGLQESIDFLANLNNQIAELRAQLSQ